MNYLESIRSALRAIRANGLRSGLTSLGIVIGIAAVTAVLILSAGSREDTKRKFLEFGASVITVRNGSGSPFGVQGGAGSKPSLTEKDAAAIAREVPDVRATAATVQGAEQMVRRNRNWSGAIVGTTPGYFTIASWRPMRGRLFDEWDNTRSAKVAVIGATVAEKLFGTEDPIGKLIRLGPVPMRVIGVLTPKGPSPIVFSGDDTVVIPLSTAKKRIMGAKRPGGKYVDSILVQAASTDVVGAVATKVTNVLRQRHNIPFDQPNDFGVENLSEILEAGKQFSRMVTLVLGIIASISLIVGGIGITNMMLVSITERTREIGLRRAVGARRKDILIQFLIEALSLSLVGGGLGILSGTAVAALATNAIGLPFIIPLHAVIIAAAFSLGVGLIFGLYPARIAAGLHPAQALRYE